MNIYLIRHGRQSSKLCNVNVALAPEGVEQARLLGERLRDERIEKVYSSDLIRAVETAAAANQIWQAEHIVKPELREISFGEMEGKSDDEIAAEYGLFKREQDKMEQDLAYPGGECVADVVARTMPLLEWIATQDCQKIAIVTHGGVIRSILSHCLGMDYAKSRLVGYGIENSSITELVHRPEHRCFMLARFNDYAHLEKDPRLLRKHWVDSEN